MSVVIEDQPPQNAMIGAWFPSILLMTRTPSGDRAEVRINGIPFFSRFRIISFVPSVICPSDVSSVPSMSLNTILQVFSFFHLYLHIFDVYPLYFHTNTTA